VLLISGGLRLAELAPLSVLLIPVVSEVSRLLQEETNDGRCISSKEG
jgi:hypothetical protein